MHKYWPWSWHCACAAFMAFVPGLSDAGVVDFEDLGRGNCGFLESPVQSRGFTFTGNPRDPSMFICDAGVIQHNTSVALLNANSRSIIFMRPSRTAAFSLHSFFAGGRTKDFEPDEPMDGYYDVATGIDVLGRLRGGGTVSALVPLDSTAPYSWDQHFLPDTFTNLSSVVFTARGQGPKPEFLLDDLVVTVQNVPEPGAVLLMSLGLATLLARRRHPCQPGARIREPVRALGPGNGRVPSLRLTDAP